MDLTTLRGLMNPSDKQDVPKAFELLKCVLDLPLALDNHTPTWRAQRHAIYLLRRVCYLITRPFTDIVFSLREQLEHLSAALYLLLILFCANPQQGYFMPTQLYVDLQLMIKNVFFCAAKEKVQDPNNNMYIILLGTD